jgi:hypothetical protein
MGVYKLAGNKLDKNTIYWGKNDERFYERREQLDSL